MDALEPAAFEVVIVENDLKSCWVFFDMADDILLIWYPEKNVEDSREEGTPAAVSVMTAGLCEMGRVEEEEGVVG